MMRCSKPYHKSENKIFRKSRMKLKYVILAKNVLLKYVRNVIYFYPPSFILKNPLLLQYLSNLKPYHKSQMKIKGRISYSSDKTFIIQSIFGHRIQISDQIHNFSPLPTIWFFNVFTYFTRFTTVSRSLDAQINFENKFQRPIWILEILAITFHHFFFFFFFFI